MINKTNLILNIDNPPGDNDSFGVSTEWKYFWEYGCYSNTQYVTAETNATSKELDNTRGWWYFSSDVNNQLSNYVQFKWVKVEPPEEQAPDTRYLNRLDKNNSIITFTNSISNIVIDCDAPTFKADLDKTQYVTINSNKRKFVYGFEDESGIDPYQIKIYVVNKDTPEVYYDFDNNEQHFGRFSNVKLAHNGSNKFLLTFQTEATEENSITPDNLNSYFAIELVDYANNKSLFILKDKDNPEQQLIEKEFKNIAGSELNDLQRLIISGEVRNDNYLIKEGVNCYIDITIQNPNTDYLSIPIAVELKDSKGYTGKIQNEYTQFDETTGTLTLRIEITKPGIVELSAWLDISDSGASQDNIDTMKDVTIATYKAPCRFRRKCNHGREYHFKPFTPNNIKDEMFGDFIAFTEDFMNTAYTSLSDDSNISMLEKIARINDLNDVSKIESDYIEHFAKYYNCEFNLNIEDLKSLNNVVVNETDYLDPSIVKMIQHSYKQMPNYNKFKGTYKGIYIALKMYGINCKLLNLYISKDSPSISTDMSYYTEEEIKNFNDYILSSNFDVEIDSKNISINDFNNYIDFYYKLINNVKPINKLLNKIKQVIKFDTNFNFYYKNLSTINETETVYSYTFGQNIDLYYINEVITSQGYLNKLKIWVNNKDKYLLSKYFTTNDYVILYVRTNSESYPYYTLKKEDTIYKFTDNAIYLEWNDEYGFTDFRNLNTPIMEFKIKYSDIYGNAIINNIDNQG